MERLKERLEQAAIALAGLDEVLNETAPSAIVRDAAIQRFEYSFEAVWKAAQRYLRIVEGSVESSPKAVVRASIACCLA